MTTQLAPLTVQHFTDNNGNLLAGGQLYTYAAGTSTPLATYTDSTGGTANANPVIMNARGEANVWTTGGLAYKFVLKDASGVTIWTVDNIADGSLDSALAAALANTTDPTKGAAMVGRAAAIVNVMDFGGVGTGLVDDTAAFNAAIAELPAAGGTVVWPVGHIFAINLVITKPGVKIQGPGITNAETVPVGNYLTHYNPALPVIQIGNDTGIVSGVTISGSQFYGANVGSIGLYFAGGAYRCNYDNVYISNFATNCFKFKGGTTYPCSYIRGVNVGISPSQSGSDGYFIDGAVSLPSYTTAIYLTNFDISAPNTSGHAVRLNSAIGNFSQGYIQAANNQGITVTSGGVFRGANVIVDTNTSSDVVFETDTSSVYLTDSLMGLVSLSGKWKNGIGNVLDTSGSSYNYYQGQFNWPLITGVATFPDPSAAGYENDFSAQVSGSGTAGSRILNLQGNQVRLNTTGGVQVFIATGLIAPFNDTGASLGQAANRWSTAYTETLQLSAAAPSGGAGTVSLGATVATTVGAAGGASAPPATPAGYLIINVAGTPFKIPYYNY